MCSVSVLFQNHPQGNKENVFYKELKVRETVQHGGRKVIFLLTLHITLFGMLFQLGFCFLEQCISKHKVTF